MHDSAYKGRLHTAIPYIGRKTLSDDQQEYNDVHGFYRARVGHLFARLWPWRIVCNVWTHSAEELHGHVPFCSTLLSFAFTDRLGINPMDPGLICLSVYGHRRRQPLRKRKMMTVFVANCVATVLVIYPSVALAT